MARAKLQNAVQIEVTKIGIEFAKAARESTGLNKEDFAVRCGLNPSRISSIENGRLDGAPKLPILARLAFGARKKLVLRRGDDAVFELTRVTTWAALDQQIFDQTKKMVVRLRTEAGMTQNDFGRMVGISSAQISLLESKGSHENAPVTLETLVKLLGGTTKDISLGFGN